MSEPANWRLGKERIMMQPPRAVPLPHLADSEQNLLTTDDLTVVVGLLAEIAPGWSAELNHASPNESTIVVTPEGANDLIGPAFVLHRTETGVELDQFRWDEFREIGKFRFLNGALAAMRARLVPLVSRSMRDAD
jgi:hypothetical protein